MSAHTPTHVCSDADCCYRGQPSSSSCRCHKPATQMMREQIDALVKALEEIVARTYSSDRRCRLGYEPVAEICDIARQALDSIKTAEAPITRDVGRGQEP